MKKTILMGLLALAMSSCGGYKPYRFYSKVNTISTVENDKATKAESHMKSLVDRSVESDSTTPTLQDLKMFRLRSLNALRDYRIHPPASST